MGIKRIGRHLLAHRWRERRDLSAEGAGRDRGRRSRRARPRIPARSASSSKARWTARRCSATSRRASARWMFSRNLRIWDTAHNNGVLIYLLLADRDVEIVADRGIDAQVGAAGWEKICAEMETRFRAGDFERGVIKGIEAVSRLLAQHFPAGPAAERAAGRAGGDVAARRSPDAAQRVSGALLSRVHVLAETWVPALRSSVTRCTASGTRKASALPTLRFALAWRPTTKITSGRTAHEPPRTAQGRRRIAAGANRALEHRLRAKPPIPRATSP